MSSVPAEQLSTSVLAECDVGWLEKTTRGVRACPANDIFSRPWCQPPEPQWFLCHCIVLTTMLLLTESQLRVCRSYHDVFTVCIPSPRHSFLLSQSGKGREIEEKRKGGREREKKGGRERRREGEREEGREGWREGGMEGGRDRGREEREVWRREEGRGREEGMEGGRRREEREGRTREEGREREEGVVEGRDADL